MSPETEVEKSFQDALDNAKRRMPQNQLLPIFRLSTDRDGLFAGNGFFLSSDGHLYHLYGMSGWVEVATDEKVIAAYARYGCAFTREDALREATRAVNEGLEKYF